MLNAFGSRLCQENMRESKCTKSKDLPKAEFQIEIKKMFSLTFQCILSLEFDVCSIGGGWTPLYNQDAQVLWRVAITKEMIKKWGKRFSGIFPLERVHMIVKLTMPAENPKTGQVKEQNRKHRWLLGTAKLWMQATCRAGKHERGKPRAVCTIYTDFFFKCKFENECCYYAHGIKGSKTRLLYFPLNTRRTEREGCEKPILHRSPSIALSYTLWHSHAEKPTRQLMDMMLRKHSQVFPRKTGENPRDQKRNEDTNLFCKFLPFYIKRFLPNIWFLWSQ